MKRTAYRSRVNERSGQLSGAEQQTGLEFSTSGLPTNQELSGWPRAFSGHFRRTFLPGQRRWFPARRDSS